MSLARGPRRIRRRTLRYRRRRQRDGPLGRRLPQPPRRIRTSRLDSSNSTTSAAARASRRPSSVPALSSCPGACGASPRGRSPTCAARDGCGGRRCPARGAHSHAQILGHCDSVLIQRCLYVIPRIAAGSVAEPGVSAPPPSSPTSARPAAFCGC